MKKLGPDILWDSTTEEVILHQIKKPEFQRRSLGHLLLAQDFLLVLEIICAQRFYFLKLHLMFHSRSFLRLKNMTCQRQSIFYREEALNKEDNRIEKKRLSSKKKRCSKISLQVLRFLAEQAGHASIASLQSKKCKEEARRSCTSAINAKNLRNTLTISAYSSL